MKGQPPVSILQAQARAANRALLLGIAAVLAITAAHYLTPAHAIRIHDVLTRLYYLPIVMVGVSCGARMGAAVGILVAVLFVPHLLTHLGGEPLGAVNLNRSFEIVMWVAVGFLTGHLADRERRALQDAERARHTAETSAREARNTARSLLEAQEQLRRADRLATLGLLSANLAHEVRNPLASLKGIGDLLRGDFPEGHPRRELLSILDEEVARLDGVVGAVLESAKGSSGDGPASLQEAVASTRALLDPSCIRQGVELQHEIPTPDLLFPLSQSLLRQVLINLALNALQAIDSRGGTIRIGARSDGARLSLWVEDEGPGFPPELAGKEPRPFFTTREHGTGLGLTITKDIVESHRGMLRLENRPEGGARVTIDFV